LISRKSVFWALRIIISAGLIGYLLATANLGEMFVKIKSCHVSFFLFSLLIGILRNVIFAYRWGVLLTGSEIKVPFITLVKFYFGGSFFNLLLPTTLGGDVVRGYDLATHSNKKMDAASSVLAERIIGSFALIFIALFALLFGRKRIENTQVINVVLIVCISYFALAIIVFNARIMKRLIALFKFGSFWKIGKRLDRMYGSLCRFFADKMILGLCFVLSIVCQTLTMVAVYLLALAINLKLPLVYFFMILPMIWIVTMVPLSINGLGVREGAFVFFFTEVGVSGSSALLFSFLNLSRMIVLGLICGTIYLVAQMPLPFKKLTKK
jgi:uncharacterized protein (TIRG00374 family)